MDRRPAHLAGRARPTSTRGSSSSASRLATGALRDGIRDVYRRRYPLTDAARAGRDLNPGAGWVSKLCHEPRVAVGGARGDARPVPRRPGGCACWSACAPIAAAADGDRVTSVTLRTRVTGGRRTCWSQAALRDRRDRDGRPAAADRHRVRHRLRVAGRHRRAQRAGSTPSPTTSRRFSVCFALEHAERRPHDRPARALRLLADYAPAAWQRHRCCRGLAPNPRTLADATQRTLRPQPGRRRCSP